MRRLTPPSDEYRIRYIKYKVNVIGGLLTRIKLYLVHFIVKLPF